MWNARLDESQAGVKTAGRNINNFRYADDTTLMAESEETLKSLLMNVKEESKKAGIKCNIQKTKIMASSPITSWQTEREKVEAVIFFTWAPKSLWTLTATMKWKDPWLVVRKSMRNLDRIFKSREVTLPTKVHIVKAMYFLVIMYQREFWILKKAKHCRIDAFEL